MNLIPKTKLNNAINYMEIEGYDCRLAVSKTHDFLETLGHANLSLIYSDSKEYKDSGDKDDLYVRSIHLRHAILDLNNCYDLLLQIPWFYYRAWQYYNKDGKLRTKEKKFQNKSNVKRNSYRWVQNAEELCTSAKLLNFYEKETNYNQIVTALNKFYETQLKYSDQKYSIRFLANQIKHNHSIIFEELHIKPEFNLMFNNEKINPRKITLDFFEIDNPNKLLGNQILTIEDDVLLDIHYDNGDSFYATDYINDKRIYSMEEVSSKLKEFHSELLKLYEIILNEIIKNLIPHPLINEPKITSTNKINMDKYFKNNN